MQETNQTITTELTPQNQYLNYSANGVAQAVAKAPPAQSEAVLWLYHHARERGLTNIREVGALIDVSPTTISQIWNGKYAAGLGGIAKKIQQLRRRWSEQALGGPEFVETSVARRLMQYGDLCHTQGKMGLVFGDGQIGKTYAMRRHASLSRLGKTFYIRTPTRPTVPMMADRLAQACHVSTKGSAAKIRDRLTAALSDTNLLWVDEVHQAFLPPLTRGRAAAGLAVIEWLRELYDETGAVLVVCGTNVWRDEVERGDYRALLSQMVRRSLPPLPLESTPQVADLRKFWQHYGLAELHPKSRSGMADETRQALDDAYARLTTIASQGIGRVQTALGMGAQLAQQQGEPMEWRHVLAADDIFREL